MKSKIYKIVLVIILVLLLIFKGKIYQVEAKEFDNLSTYYDSEVLKKYDDLLNLVNLKESSNYDYLYSKIIFKDIYDFRDEVTILRGKNDGLKDNMAVLDNLGLIGVVCNVGDEESKVKLLSNSSVNLSVVVGEYYGILNYSNGYYIRGISSSSGVNIGDMVYTSGLGHLPAGLVIGKVISIQNDGVEKIIKIDIVSKLDKASHVVIIKDLL